MAESIECIAKERGYLGFELVEEGQKVNWTMPEWAVKDGLSVQKALPPWLEPVGKLPEEVPEEELELTEDQRESKIIAAVESLDHTDDDHWTEGGWPQVEAVKAACGFKVSRAEIKALCPGLERQEQ